MRILISGSTGYLGGRITKYLENDYLISKGIKNSSKKKGYNKLDVTKSDDIKKCTQNTDTIIHLAALNSFDSEEDKIESHKVNVDGTKLMFKYGKENKIKKFIYFSTAHVYGSNLKNNVSELTKLLPISQYGLTHKLAEENIINQNKENGIQLIILRPSNIVGIPENYESNDWSLVVSDLCKQAITKKILKVNSYGNQTRDFLSMEKFLPIVKELVDYTFTPQTKIFNIGGDCILSIREIAQIIQMRCKALLNFEPKIQFETKRTKNILNNYECEKVKKLFKNFMPNKSSVISAIDDMLLFTNKAFHNEQ